MLAHGLVKRQRPHRVSPEDWTVTVSMCPSGYSRAARRCNTPKQTPRAFVDVCTRSLGKKGGGPPELSSFLQFGECGLKHFCMDVKDSHDRDRILCVKGSPRRSAPSTCGQSSMSQVDDIFEGALAEFLAITRRCQIQVDDGILEAADAEGATAYSTATDQGASASRGPPRSWSSHRSAFLTGETDPLNSAKRRKTASGRSRRPNSHELARPTSRDEDDVAMRIAGTSHDQADSALHDRQRDQDTRLTHTADEGKGEPEWDDDALWAALSDWMTDTRPPP